MERSLLDKPPVKSSKNLLKIALLATLFFTSCGASLAPLIVLQIDKICSDLFANSSIAAATGLCDREKAQQYNSSLQSVILFIDSSLAILVAGKMGEVSDKYGRKKALLLCLLFFFVGSVATAVLLTTSIEFVGALYVLARAVPGLCGSVKSILGIFRSYAIDVVDVSERATALSVIVGCLFFGFATGPFVSKAAKAWYGNDYAAMYISSIGLAISLLGVWLFIPETRSRKVVASPTSLKEVFKSLSLFSVPNKSRQNKIWLLMCIDVITNSAMVTLASCAVLYGTLKFQWSSTEIGYLLSLGGSTKAFASFVIVPFYMKMLSKRGYHSRHDRLGMVDISNIRLALVVNLLELAIILLTNKSKWIFVASVIASFSVISIPTIHSSFVKLCSDVVGHGDDSRVGELFGALALIESVSMMVITAGIMMIFSRTSLSHPKAAFIVLFGLLSLAMVFALCLKEETSVDLDESDDEVESVNEVDELEVLSGDELERSVHSGFL